MTMQFTETAPGVHTTSLVHPKTNRCYNIAVIESSNAWQVFIDGELAVRDQPSFKAACSRAQKQILNPGSPRMLRAASILVLVTVAGASAVGIAKLLPASSPAALAAQTRSENLASAPRSTFQRVRLPQTKPEVLVKTALHTAPKTTPQTSPGQPEQLTKPAIAVASPEMPAQAARKPHQQAALEPSAPAKIRRFSSSNTVFDRLPVADSEKTASVEAVEIVKITPTVTTAEPAAPTATAKISTATAAVASPSPVATDAPEVKPVKAAANEPEPAKDVTRTSASDIEPARTLPQETPVTAAPLIRSTANTPFERPKLNALLATIDEEAEESTVVRRSPSSSAPGKPEVSKRRKTTSSRAIREQTATHKPRSQRRRYHRRQRFAEERRYYGEHRSSRRRVVCFAHTCRMR